MTDFAQPTEKVLFAQFARIGKALANPTRLELLDLLTQAPRSVEKLAHLVGQTVAATSHHLQSLRSARLVEGHKDGLYVTYRLSDEEVSAFWRRLQQLARQRLPEVRDGADDLAGGANEAELIDRIALTARMRRGAVTLLDVRPREEYEAGHVPSAVCMPLDQLAAVADTLPRDREIVVYGRGPYSALGSRAVDLLAKQGRRARRLLDGIPQWRQAGLPVAVEPPE